MFPGTLFEILLLAPLWTHTMVSSVIFLVNFVGTERWVVCAPFMSGMSRRTFWLVLLHSEYSWQWYRKDTWGWGQGGGGEKKKTPHVNKTHRKTLWCEWVQMQGRKDTTQLCRKVYLLQLFLSNDSGGEDKMIRFLDKILKSRCILLLKNTTQSREVYADLRITAVLLFSYASNLV